jgi:hypothetical protein
MNTDTIFPKQIQSDLIKLFHGSKDAMQIASSTDLLNMLFSQNFFSLDPNDQDLTTPCETEKMPGLIALMNSLADSTQLFRFILIVQNECIQNIFTETYLQFISNDNWNRYLPSRLETILSSNAAHIGLFHQYFSAETNSKNLHCLINFFYAYLRTHTMNAAPHNDSCRRIFLDIFSQEIVIKKDKKGERVVRFFDALSESLHTATPSNENSLRHLMLAYVCLRIFGIKIFCNISNDAKASDGQCGVANFDLLTLKKTLPLIFYTHDIPKPDAANSPFDKTSFPMPSPKEFWKVNHRSRSLDESKAKINVKIIVEFLQQLDEISTTGKAGKAVKSLCLSELKAMSRRNDNHQSQSLNGKFLVFALYFLLESRGLDNPTSQDAFSNDTVENAAILRTCTDSRIALESAFFCLDLCILTAENPPIFTQFTLYILYRSLLLGNFISVCGQYTTNYLVHFSIHDMLKSHDPLMDSIYRQITSIPATGQATYSYFVNNMDKLSRSIDQPNGVRAFHMLMERFLSAQRPHPMIYAGIIAVLIYRIEHPETDGKNEANDVTYLLSSDIQVNGIHLSFMEHMSKAIVQFPLANNMRKICRNAFYTISSLRQSIAKFSETLQFFTKSDTVQSKTATGNHFLEVRHRPIADGENFDGEHG